MMLILCIIDTVSIKKFGESKYVIQCLMLISYIGSVLGSELLLCSVVLAIILIIFNNIYLRIKKSFKDNSDIMQEFKLPKTRIGFFLGISTIIVAMLETFITYM
jgi:hypothetical protein